MTLVPRPVAVALTLTLASCAAMPPAPSPAAPPPAAAAFSTHVATPPRTRPRAVQTYLFCAGLLRYGAREATDLTTGEQALLAKSFQRLLAAATLAGYDLKEDSQAIEEATARTVAFAESADEATADKVLSECLRLANG